MAKATTKTAGKAANTTENAVASAITSSYNTLIPLKDACGVYVKHPTSSKTIRVSTYSPEFLAIYQELVELGMKDRLDRELLEFAQAHGDGWNKVREWLGAQSAHVGDGDSADEVA